METLKKYLQEVEDVIKAQAYGEQPRELYDPISYIMSLGGKRLRPLLTILGYRLFKKDHEQILKAAISVEVFHNFTLMHDDIMDQAPLRRGQQTVHEKWSEPVAILSGDVMLVRAYDLLLSVPADKLAAVLKRFNATAAEVCEGQQHDMNFEQETAVTEARYIDMIRQKTAVLLGYSLELGAILAGADEASAKKLYEFGVKIGIGFQLKDDLLDVYAEQDKFGKQVGGDIISNKKTFLLINALERANHTQSGALKYWLDQKDFDKEQKVKAVMTIYDELQIKELTLHKMNQYFQEGFALLDQLDIDPVGKKELIDFAQYLIERDK